MFDSIELFDSLNQQEKETLSLFCQERLLSEGEVLFQEGDDANAMYIVKSWMLRVYQERSEGEKSIGLVDTWGFVGEMALFDSSAPKKRMASVRSMGQSRLLVIMDYAILDLSKRYKEIFEKISYTIAHRKAQK